MEQTFRHADGGDAVAREQVSPHHDGDSPGPARPGEPVDERRRRRAERGVRRLLGVVGGICRCRCRRRRRRRRDRLERDDLGHLLLVCEPGHRGAARGLDCRGLEDVGGVRLRRQGLRGGERESAATASNDVVVVCGDAASMVLLLLLLLPPSDDGDGCSAGGRGDGDGVHDYRLLKGGRRG